MKCTKLILNVHHAAIYKVLLIENDKKFATASEDNTISIWLTVSCKFVATLTGHSGFVYCLVSLKDSRYLIINKTIFILDL